MSNTYAIYLPSLEQMQQNVDKITFITHKDDLKMKEEDLKVGTILYHNRILSDCSIIPFELYWKIFNITNEKYFLYALYIDKENGNDFTCLSRIKYMIIRGINENIYKIVDKVPAKIEEVEEEIPIFIEKDEYDKLKDENFYCAYVKNFNSSFDNRTELCKIKRKVKKELNFSWEKNLWE